MNTKVTGCTDCPLFHDGERYEYAHYCKHPNSIQDVRTFISYPEIELEWKNENETPITPDWCPLKKEEITIKLIG